MTPLKDLKEGLSSNRKADLTHIRYAFATYCARPCEYGCDKYERANFLRATGDGPHDVPTAADFDRFRKYLRAMISHGLLVLDSMERHQANDPKLRDVEGMKAAAYAVDVDPDMTGKTGPSFLPHVAMCGSSLMMAIEQAVDCGLLPRDPGTPWKARAEETKRHDEIAEHRAALEFVIGQHIMQDAMVSGNYTLEDVEKPVYRCRDCQDKCDGLDDVPDAVEQLDNEINEGFSKAEELGAVRDEGMKY